ncbi:MAG: DUF1835 domain-containing protein [Gemmatimonadaceae bacterium]|nr:DUF1835 domain-containing protein [Gemmatimonadaceae bacterium]
MTNGDYAAQGLARSGLPGDVLAWRDVLPDGPVPADDDRAVFRTTRARFLAERHWATAAEVEEDLLARDARLDGLSATDGIVLWFEPDLYDQLQLIQVLARLARRDAASRPSVSIVPADLMLGSLAPAKFRPLYDARRPIADIDLAHGLAAWEAFTSSTPDALVALVTRLDAEIAPRTYDANDSVRLPHLAASLRRMLEEYPDADTGLSRSERQICEALTSGPRTLSALFRAAHHASESWPWLGDWSFAWYVQRLSDVAKPLVTHVNGSRVLAPIPGPDDSGFWERSVMLTPFGSDVVRARADMVSVNGIDRWIGGVSLTAGRYWRWDGTRQRTVESGDRQP